MTKYDTNIVLVSAAAVLLATKSCSSSAFAFTPQQQIGNHHPSSIINHQFHQNVKGIHPIIRNKRCDLLQIESTTSTSLYSSPRRGSDQDSWSKRATIMSSTKDSTPTRGKEGSRYGVRSRVKSVLERAKKRTGIRNNSEDYLNSSKPSSSPASLPTRTKIIKTTSSVTNVVAEAASIGGLGAVVVDEKEGKIDVALDYVPPSKSSLGKQTQGGENDGDKNMANGQSSTSSGVQLGDAEKKNLKETKELPTTAATTSTSKGKKTSPASTYSPSNISTSPQPEDILIPAAKNTSNNKEQPSQPAKKASIPEIDVLKGDVSAAFSMPPPPLPFTLPKLSREQNNQLMNGERVQFQSDMGREGSGFIAVDVKAPADVIWECLLDFYSYPQTIPTVRDVKMFTNTHLAQDYYAEKEVDRIKYEDGTLATLKHGIPSVTRAAFTVSKLQYTIAAIHKYRPHPQGDYMIFTLDPACTNLVLQSAKGVWHTQSNPDGRGEVSDIIEVIHINVLLRFQHLNIFRSSSLLSCDWLQEYTRVWLLCELKVSSLLPKWIVDYAAKKAMPRASSWIKPHCEAASELWFKELD